VARTLSGRGDRQLELVPGVVQAAAQRCGDQTTVYSDDFWIILMAVGRRLLSCLSTAFVDHANKTILRQEKRALGTAMTVAFLCLAAWFFNAPAFRFGIGFLVACAMLVSRREFGLFDCARIITLRQVIRKPLRGAFLLSKQSQ